MIDIGSGDFVVLMIRRPPRSTRRSSDLQGGGISQHNLIRRSPNGKTHYGKAIIFLNLQERKPSELKHLSN